MNDRTVNILRNFFLAVLSLVLLIPFYICLISAFKFKEDIVNNPITFIISNLTFENFTKVAVTPTFNIFQAYGTTILITLFSIVFVLIFAGMLSYVIARIDNKFLLMVYLLLLGGMVIPPQVILIPLVNMLEAMGLMFSPAGLILFNIGWYMPFSVFVYTGFIRSLPKEIDESAKVDGANVFQIYWKIIFPLIKPPTATISIFLFLWVWNDFLMPHIILGSTKGYTVTTGIYRSIGPHSVEWNEIFALVVLASIPVFIMYLFIQRFIIEGFTEGSVK